MIAMKSHGLVNDSVKGQAREILAAESVKGPIEPIEDAD